MNTSCCSPLVKVAATQDGALHAYESRCACGLVIRSSLATLAQAEVAAHVAYHDRQKGGRS